MAEEKKIAKAKKPRKAPPNKDVIAYWTEGEGLSKIKEWLDAGLYDKDIAANIGITQKCLTYHPSHRLSRHHHHLHPNFPYQGC